MSTGAVGEQHRVGAVEVDRRSEVANRLVVPPFLEGCVPLRLQGLSHSWVSGRLGPPGGQLGFQVANSARTVTQSRAVAVVLLVSIRLLDWRIPLCVEEDKF